MPEKSDSPTSGPFLRQTASWLFNAYKEKVSDLCIVLPNRRGGLFLKKYLGAVVGTTIWAPAIFSIEDFLTGLSGMQICETTKILFELYEVHRSIEGKDSHSFEDFIGWGLQLINDFNEIDSWLADPGKLFTYLTEVRAISVWNLDQKPLTDFETKYLQFYRSLDRYYTELKKRLLDQHMAYPGLLYRSVAEDIETISKTIPWMKIIFAGFSALTASEERIIDELYIAGKADLLWDADHYYLDNPQQEAGDFLRKWLKKWPLSGQHGIGNDLLVSSKNITITGVPFNIGQVKYSGHLLSEYQEKQIKPEECAVVLMDEQLLIPLLNSVPANVAEMNITMGLPLKQTTLYSLISDMFRLHENLMKFKKAENGEPGFYYRDILRILRHPYVMRAAEFRMQGNLFVLEDLTESLRSGNRIFVTKEQLLKQDTGLFSANLSFLEIFFEPWTDPLHAIENIRNVITMLRDSLITTAHLEPPGGTQPAPVMEMEYLYAFSKIVFQVSSLIVQYGSVKSIATLHRLFDRLTESTLLPFYGEPLKGIQVMGMLETRTLDFENIILLSVNEDILPGSKTNSSFIPYDIRRTFRLPTWQHRNSVYAYHFYRLLQRAKEVNILYNTEPDELGGGEKSRFIIQMLNELRNSNPGVTITEQIFSTPLTTSESLQHVIVRKDPDILQRLDELAAKGLSPSLLNQYRSCSLKFYFSAIAGLEETTEPEDAIDVKVLGQAVHYVLHQLFKPVTGNVLTVAAIDPMFPLIDDLTINAFEKESDGADVSYGKNLLLLNVAKIMVRNYLKFEKKRVADLEKDKNSTTIKFLEFLLFGQITIRVNNESRAVQLKGFADRIDRAGDEWQIIDYKTGKVDPKQLKIGDWDELITNTKVDMAFQMLTYSYLLGSMNKKENRMIHAGIVALKKVRSGFLPVVLPVAGKNSGTIDQKSLKDFEGILIRLLEDIYNPDVPFRQTEDREICEKCPFVNFCAR